MIGKMEESDTNLSGSQSANVGARVHEKRNVDPELESETTYRMYGRRLGSHSGKSGVRGAAMVKEAKESLREKKERKAEGKRKSEKGI